MKNYCSKNTILIQNNLVEISAKKTTKPISNQLLGTVLANLSYFGYTLSVNALNKLRYLSEDNLKAFWTNVEADFKHVSGDSRNMGKFVVYKNFPKEVLDMSQAQYWISQILMYVGLPNEFFTEEEKDRPKLIENLSLRVLQLSDDNSLNAIYDNLTNSKTRWTDNQQLWAKWFIANENNRCISVSKFGFKENAIELIAENNKCIFEMKDATDVLRLAARMSNADVSLREKIKFKNFKREQRKLFLWLLECSSNLEEDVATRKSLWKQLFRNIHPGDYKDNFPKVAVVYDSLYNKKLKSFNQKVDPEKYSINSLNILKSRPGEFLRRFYSYYSKLGSKVVDEFINIVPKLNTLQLVKFDRYINTINHRKTVMIPPKGNWSKARIFDNSKKIEISDILKISTAIGVELSSRINNLFPKGIKLDDNLNNIKLATNDQKLAEYGRGTTFIIPDNVNYLRSASYWQSESKTGGNVWFDNGWNFFNDYWSAAGTCCWSTANYSAPKGSVFSGDPTNSKDLKGRACQMIDLNINKLLASGVRYAVWNILCYSNVKFADAADVLATLQWGENPEDGKLYEPSRAQMVFPLKSNSLTSYVAYVDLKERKLVYMDAGLGGSVHSADNNRTRLETNMPAYVEYLNSLPSVYDLVSRAKKGKTPFLYSDKDVKIKSGNAFVFKKENEENKYIDISLSDIL